ncbi:MAG: hypothetical protein K2I79_03050 [Clostridia bacterium]|nr:hypothetical protein [Clostridia bacterium]
MIMGMGDVIVATHTPDTVGKAYEAAGNSYYAALKITYAGHGADSLLSGRFNQSFVYYAERFMEKFAA